MIFMSRHTLYYATLIATLVWSVHSDIGSFTPVFMVNYTGSDRAGKVTIRFGVVGGWVWRGADSRIFVRLVLLLSPWKFFNMI